MGRAVVPFALLVALALSLLNPPSATAAAVVTIDPPRPASAHTAILSGTVPGQRLLAIESWQADRWRYVMNVTSDRTGVWQATVPAGAEPVSYRARAGTNVSDAVVVQAAPEPAPAPVPVPDPEPEPAPEPGQPPADECGPQPRKPDGSYWSCTLADDFAGTELDRSLWVPQQYFRTGTNEAFACYRDDPSVISVSEGSLHLGLRELPEPFACEGARGLPTRYLAGMVSTWHTFSQQYGRFEARIRVSDVDGVGGLHEAFWMWPDQRYEDPTVPWPASGEIDISETFSEHPISLPYLHYGEDDNGGPVPGLNTSFDCHAERGEYHTYTLEWSADRIEIFVDGTSCLVNEEGDPAFDKPYHLILTEGLNVNFTKYDPRVRLPVSMDVDYVRAWE